ncbi:hypothetical protein CJ030_MR6G021498 [Morella rubra]|nr:hypothetical protein CJ030_MR6G021498 [Morella rubra]
MNTKLNAQVVGCHEDEQPLVCPQEDKHRAKLDVQSAAQPEEHEHVFLPEDQSFDEKSLVLIKRCHCGFSVQVEEL